MSGAETGAPPRDRGCGGAAPSMRGAEGGGESVEALGQELDLHRRRGPAAPLPLPPEESVASAA